MSGRRHTVLMSVAVLVAVLPSCSGNPQGDAPATLADATTGASQSSPTGSLPGDANPDDGDGPSAGRTGDQSGGATGSGATGEPATPPVGSGAGTSESPAGSGTGGAPPPAGSGTDGPAPPASSAAGRAAPPPPPPPPPPPAAPAAPAGPAGPATGSVAPPAGPATSSSAPPADPGPARPGGEPAGGSSSAPRPGGAPPKADIIDELDGFAFYSQFKADQLARCEEFPNCVEVRLDTANSPEGATEEWCAFDTNPPRHTLLTEVIEKNDGVIEVSVIEPQLNEADGVLECVGPRTTGN